MSVCSWRRAHAVGTAGNNFSPTWWRYLIITNTSSQNINVHSLFINRKLMTCTVAYLSKICQIAAEFVKTASSLSHLLGNYIQLAGNYCISRYIFMLKKLIMDPVIWHQFCNFVMEMIFPSCVNSMQLLEKKMMDPETVFQYMQTVSLSYNHSLYQDLGIGIF